MAPGEANDRDGSSPDESRKERVDRELIELLNELRLAVPGVQVLFAFLLIVPFQQGFQNVSDTQRTLYFIALLSTTASGLLIITPSAYHRLIFRRQRKERLLFDSNKMLILAGAFLAVAITCSIALVADVLYGGTVALICGALVLITAIGLWFVLPLMRRGPPEP